MQVQVEHLLSPLPPHMEFELIAGDAVCFGEDLSLTNEQPGNVRRLLRKIVDGGNEITLFFRNEEQMRRRLGMNVFERHHFIILEDNRRGNLMIADFMEEGLLAHKKMGVLPAYP